MKNYYRHYVLFSIILLVTLLSTSCADQDITQPKLTFAKVLLNTLSWIIRFLVVPAILGITVYVSKYIAWLPSENEYQRISKTYAFWLGCVIFVLVVGLNIFTGFLIPDQPVDAFRVALLFVTGGFIVGAAMMAAVHSFIKTRAISIFVLILSSSGLSTMYFYLFVERLRDAILLLAVSMLIGSLAYVVLFPSVVKSFDGNNRIMQKTRR